MFNIEKFKKIAKILKKHNNSEKIVAISKNHPVESILEAINQGVYILEKIGFKKQKLNIQKLNKITQK
jgi:hypothetical protein